MIAVNIHDAKTNLSTLLAKVEKRHETIIVCRSGTPVAEILPFSRKKRADPLAVRPELACMTIKGDLTAPLSEEEWPEAAP